VYQATYPRPQNTHVEYSLRTITSSHSRLQGAPGSLVIHTSIGHL